MMIDSHEHIMLPTEKQLQMMDKAGVDKTILFCSTPHPENAASLTEIETEMARSAKFYPERTTRKPIESG